MLTDRLVDFIHPELNKTVKAIGGEYVFIKEDILSYADQDVLYLANAGWAGIHGVATLRIDSPSLFRQHIDLHRQIDLAVDTFIRGITDAP